MASGTLTNSGANLRRVALLSFIDARAKYVAVGTSSTAPAAGQTALGSESFRKAITSTANGGGAGEAILTLYLAPQDAVGVTIAEVGWFGGASASGTPGSGVMIARGLYSHSKTDAESIVVTFDIILV